MTPLFTVILPHKLNPRNNDALNMCIDCLLRNTRNEFRLSMSAALNQPVHAVTNELIGASTTDCIVFLNSDMFVAPGWDEPMLALWDERTIVTNVLVEPGAIGVYHQNLTHDFGRKPEQFRRAEFEDWTQTAPMLDGEGWYAPYMLSRKSFLTIGGLNTALGEFQDDIVPVDKVMFDTWKSRGGFVRRARSYTYHLQRWSDTKEQEHSKRDVQP